MAPVEIPDITACKPKSKVSLGGDCGSINSGLHNEKNPTEFLAWLDANPKKPEAICASADDFGRLITALDLFCTDIGDYCTLEMQQQITNLESIVDSDWNGLSDVKTVDPE